MRNRLLLTLMLVAALSPLAAARAEQCVPFARDYSGIDLRGNAWTWWNHAAGVYERGQSPRLGAVIVFRKFGKMRLGHVAVVTQVLGPRDILIDHANWGTRGVVRGQVTTSVAVRDISRKNDWTAVQVWDALAQDYGTRGYPTYGFIYPKHRPQVTLFDATLPAQIASALAGQTQANEAPKAELPFVVAMDLAPIDPIPLPAVAIMALDGAESGAAPADPVRSKVPGRGYR